MLQMMTTLSARSRITSSSYSFQPAIDCSTRIWLVGLSSKPFSSAARNSSGVYAMPPPVPPSVNDGRIIAGSPTRSRASAVWSSDVTMMERGVIRPISAIAWANRWRSSASSIASTLAPISLQPYFASTPALCSASPRFSPVWPPTVGSTLSGRSLAMMSVSASTVSGSM